MKTAVALLALLWFLPSLGAAQPTKATNAQDQESYDFEAIQRNHEDRPFVKPADVPDPIASMTDSLERWPMAVNLDDLKRMIGYPVKAKEREIEGAVIVRVLVDQSGNFVKVIYLKDPHPILTKAIADRVNQLTFTPGIQYGKPVAAWITIRFDFRLLSYNDLGQNAPRPADDQWICDALAKHLPFNAPEKLTTLTLQHQELEEFPQCMRKFIALKRLDLSDNRIRELSPEMTDLKALETLIVSNNELQSLPEELWRLPNLKAVYVDGNNFSEETRNDLERHRGKKLFPKDAAGNVSW